MEVWTCVYIRNLFHLIRRLSIYIFVCMLYTTPYKYKVYIKHFVYSFDLHFHFKSFVMELQMLMILFFIRYKSHPRTVKDHWPKSIPPKKNKKKMEEKITSLLQIIPRLQLKSWLFVQRKCFDDFITAILNKETFVYLSDMFHFSGKYNNCLVPNMFYILVGERC